VVTLAVVAGALAAATLYWAPRIAERRIDERVLAARTALVDVRNSLPDAQTALSTATEPDVDTTALSSVVPTLAALASAAESLDREATATLPAAAPFVGSSDRETLAAVQDRFGFMSAEADAISRRVATVVDYRLGASGLLDLPDLPDTATGEELRELGIVLAAALADGVTLATELPSDAALATHRQALLDLLTWFGDWQVDYLDALRRTSSEQASELAAEYTSRRATLDALLVPVLASLREEIDTMILELARQLDNTLLRLPP
jgi:hypothetical protein